MRPLIGLFAGLFLTAGMAAWGQTALYQDNKKAVLYVGTTAPTLDGTLNDWQGLLGSSPEVWTYGRSRGNHDPSAVFVLRSDNKKLYVNVEVKDSVANENDLPAPLAWRNDSVELYLGTDTSAHTRYTTSDNQIRLVPVSRTDTHLIGVSVNDRIVDTERDVQGTVIYTDAGYRIQAAIPLRLLQIKGFTAGQALRCEFQINDATSGERENLVHWKSKLDNTYFDASAWGDGVVEALPEGH